MAKMLPDTPAKLKEIDQMTDVRVEKFGHVIFAVCKVRREFCYTFLII